MADRCSLGSVSRHMATMNALCTLVFFAIAAAFPESQSLARGPIVVSGATGRTGHLIYRLLKGRGVPVRAFVRNQTKARELLDCGDCGVAEGIFEGDITSTEDIRATMKGAGGLVIATSSVPICDPYPKCHFPPGGMPIDVDWKGGKNQIAAFASLGNGGPISLISTKGTTDSEFMSSLPGHISFYKLNLESALMASWPSYTIIKPCGLGNGPPAQNELFVGHDDTLNVTSAVARADIARVVVASIVNPRVSKGLRFDICSQAGAPTKDRDVVTKVLKAARYPWDRTSSSEEVSVPNMLQNVRIYS